MTSLDNKVIAITGASGLLGEAFVRACLAAGANVAALDLNISDALTALATETAALQNYALDVTDKTSVDATVADIVARWQRLDGWVNSAAIDPKFDADVKEQQANTFEDYPLNLWEDSLRVNLTGVFLCCQAAGKVMVAQGSGVIVNLASTYGLVGPDQRLYLEEGETEQHLFKPATYSVTKGGIVNFTRYLATYWGNKNVRVNSLTPGGVANNQPSEFVARYAYRTPLGRMAKKDEISKTLVFMLSDDATYMTGSNLVVDGGWTAW